jgi:L-ascorbate metabolism protein UlaG (beta-lactamase superfamily)
MKNQFGGKVDQLHIEQYKLSLHWDGKKFINLEETKMEFSFQALPKFLHKQFCEKEAREPKVKLPIVPFDKQAFLKPSKQAKLIWYGHSVVLMRMNEQTILIDPMLGSNAAPIAPFAVKRFSENTLDLIDDFPEIDLLLLTHDHYDHLDYDSIQKLKPKVKHYFVALGIARHLVKWGIPESQISEFDWWEDKLFENIKITFTPTRHFSGRGLRDRAKSLWGGWVFTSENENIWFSGDGGYGNHFKSIGEKLGPFDFAFMECGQYNPNWHQIHMYPEESVQAAIDAKAQKIIPVHWSGFSLAQHTWTEPVERFISACEQKGMPYITPPKGQLISLNDTAQNEHWWKQF